MANIKGRPFIEHQIQFLMKSGFHRFVVCSGYGQDYMRELFLYRPTSIMRAAICIVEEQRQLGTAAAIVGAIPDIATDPFLIVNGDTICEMDYGRMVRDHYRGQGGKLTALSVTIAGVFNRLPLPTWIPAGAWLCSKKLFPYLFMGIPRLEMVLIKMEKDHSVGWFMADRFWDIGSPEGLEAFRGGW